ncbi:hypothetical protein C6401_13945 [Arthrobacter woluwensis]|nr:hypothetical protein C6401_13945 [Arthrobacter woluwensis]
MASDATDLEPSVSPIGFAREIYDLVLEEVASRRIISSGMMRVPGGTGTRIALSAGGCLS